MTNENFPKTPKFTNTFNPGSKGESNSSFDSVEVNEIKDNFFFDRNGELRVVFNFMLLLIFHVVVSITIIFVLGLLLPDYFGLGTRTLILIGMVAIIFAFKDMRKV